MEWGSQSWGNPIDISYLPTSPKRRVAMPWKGEAGTPLAPGSKEAPARAWAEKLVSSFTYI